MGRGHWSLTAYPWGYTAGTVPAGPNGSRHPAVSPPSRTGMVLVPAFASGTGTGTGMVRTPSLRSRTAYTVLRGAGAATVTDSNGATPPAVIAASAGLLL